MNFAKFLRTPFLTEHLWWLETVILRYSTNYTNLKIKNKSEKYLLLGNFSNFVVYTVNFIVTVVILW